MGSEQGKTAKDSSRSAQKTTAEGKRTSRTSTATGLISIKSLTPRCDSKGEGEPCMFFFDEELRSKEKKRRLSKEYIDRQRLLREKMKAAE